MTTILKSIENFTDSEIGVLQRMFEGVSRLVGQEGWDPSFWAEFASLLAAERQRRKAGGKPRPVAADFPLEASESELANVLLFLQRLAVERGGAGYLKEAVFLNELMGTVSSARIRAVREVEELERLLGEK
jgi:hypothetical protein